MTTPPCFSSVQVKCGNVEYHTETLPCVRTKIINMIGPQVQENLRKAATLIKSENWFSKPIIA